MAFPYSGNPPIPSYPDPVHHISTQLATTPASSSSPGKHSLQYFPPLTRYITVGPLIHAHAHPHPLPHPLPQPATVGTRHDKWACCWPSCRAVGAAVWRCTPVLLFVSLVPVIRETLACPAASLPHALHPCACLLLPAGAVQLWGCHTHPTHRYCTARRILHTLPRAVSSRRSHLQPVGARPSHSDIQYHRGPLLPPPLTRSPPLSLLGLSGKIDVQTLRGSLVCASVLDAPPVIASGRRAHSVLASRLSRTLPRSPICLTLSQI